jgi:hypothetical protein
MWRVFLTLYFSYLILGPHWESRLMEKKPLRIVDSPKEFFRRSIFISYTAILYTTWFLYNPSYSSAINALLLSGSATYGFYTKYGPEKPFPMHILLNLFILFMGTQYFDTQTLFTFLLLIFYYLTQDILYFK